MVEFRDRAEIEEWLRERPNTDAIVLAARVALRVLPLLITGVAPWHEKRSLGIQATAIALQTFRGTCMAWTSAKYLGHATHYIDLEKVSHDVRSASRAADASAYASDAAANACRAAAAYAFRSAFSFDTYLLRRDSASAYAYGAAAAVYTSRDSLTASAASDFSRAFMSDATALELEMPASDLADRTLWPADAPLWAAKAWADLKTYLLGQDEDWQVWTAWYEARRDGRKVRRKAIEIARMTLPETLWKAGPRAVNAEIRRLMEAKQLKEKPKNAGEPTPDLGQRRSSHRFAWQSGKLEAIAVTEAPFDSVLAGAIAEALREKATELLAGLVGNHADPIVSRDVQRALDLLADPIERIAEGLLLMRANTITAHAHAYADASSNRERSIRAALDDFSTSLGNLVDCYPGVRRIAANRLELEVQAADVSAISAELDAVALIARDGAAVAASALDALNAGREQAEGLGEKIELASGQVRAGYIEARAEVVASRVLNATNFVSATAQKAEVERAGMKLETLRELRKALPKPLARGLSKATEKTITSLPDAAGVGMAYLVVGHWGALALLVGRLAPHARKIQQIADAIDKLLRGGSDDEPSSDDDA